MLTESQNKQDGLNHYKLPTITICVGILAAIFVFSLMLNLSMKQLERSFTNDSRLRMAVLKNWLYLNSNALENLSHALSPGGDVGERIFHLTADTLATGNGVDGLYWVTQSGNASPMVHSAASRSGGMPDILANPALMKRIKSSIESGKPDAIPSLAFPTMKHEDAGMVFPIAQQGALIALFNPVELFDTSGSEISRNANSYIFEELPDAEEKLLYGQSNEFMHSALLAFHSPTSALIEKSVAFSYSETIPLLSHQLKILIVPTSHYMTQANMVIPWIVMVACLALSGMAGIFLFHLIGQNARIEQVVRDRTAELMHTSSELKARSLALEKAIVEAQSANIAKSDFLANVSHEIRTPLNSMIGMTELLLETELTSQQEKHINTVLESSETLLEIINDILDFSKIESGKLELSPIPFDLEAAIEDTAELFAPRVREKEQQLELLVHFLPGTPRHIVGDPVRVRQILSNLMSNAIKFTKTGYVLVTAEEVAGDPVGEKTRIKLSVRDTGIGIPPDKLHVIFDKFSQADVSTTRKFGGTGLGLAICRQLAQMMKGEVVAQSTPGEGSTFSATLLFDRAPAPADAAAPDHSVLQGKRALIVDQLVPSRAILAAQLAMAGIECESVPDAISALKMLSDMRKINPFDMLITDYILPETVSDVFTQEAKKLCPAMAVIVITALAEKGYSQIFASAGCDAYLTKPVRAAQLLDLLVMIFEARRAGKHLSMLTPLNIFRKGATDRSTDDSGFLEDAEILLVEDNRANRELVIKLLENFSCRVTAVRNGEEAVEIVRQQSFDLILMDCQMPEMDGFEASAIISAMKERGEVGPMPIIALTANAMKGDRERCLESGMNDYITKPLRKTKLRSILMQWLPPKEKRVVHTRQTHAA